MTGKPKVLLVADECNPEWPSLPIVGYKYALENAKLCDVTLATHVRNRENIEKAAPTRQMSGSKHAKAAPPSRWLKTKRRWSACFSCFIPRMPPQIPRFTLAMSLAKRPGARDLPASWLRG